MSRVMIDGLQDVGTILEGLSDNVETVPLAFQLGRVRFRDLAKMSIYAIAFLKGWANVAFDLKILAVLDMILSFLSVLWKRFVKGFDLFVESLVG